MSAPRHRIVALGRCACGWTATVDPQVDDWTNVLTIAASDELHVLISTWLEGITRPRP